MGVHLQVFLKFEEKTRLILPQNLWTSILQDPKARLSEISCLDELEWKNVVLDWNQTRMEVKGLFDCLFSDSYSDVVSVGKCVHRLFEQQVFRAPFATAVCDGPLHFTYYDFNQRANQLVETSSRFLI